MDPFRTLLSRARVASWRAAMSRKRTAVQSTGHGSRDRENVADALPVRSFSLIASVLFVFDKGVDENGIVQNCLNRSAAHLLLRRLLVSTTRKLSQKLAIDLCAQLIIRKGIGEMFKLPDQIQHSIHCDFDCGFP